MPQLVIAPFSVFVSASFLGEGHVFCPASLPCRLSGLLLFCLVHLALLFRSLFLSFSAPVFSS